MHTKFFHKIMQAKQLQEEFVDEMMILNGSF
jgi:hypothetical protein